MFTRCIGLALMWGLAHFSASAAQYPDSAKSTRTEVTVRVIWLANHHDVDLACSYFGSMPPSGDLTKRAILGCYLPWNTTIIAVEPTSFNDEFHLEVLGHEFWHALGATHPDD